MDISLTLTYFVFLAAVAGAIIFLFKYRRRRRAMWQAKRMEAIESALSLSASVDAQLAGHGEAAPDASEIERLNGINALQGELGNILEELRHYRPNRTALLLDKEMALIEETERRLDALSEQVQAICGKGPKAT